MSAIRAAEVQTPALVYVRGLRGTSPQIWWQPVSDIEGFWRDRILAWHRLDGVTAGRPLSDLTRIFPPPVVRADAEKENV